MTSSELYNDTEAIFVGDFFIAHSCKLFCHLQIQIVDEIPRKRTASGGMVYRSTLLQILPALALKLFPHGIIRAVRVEEGLHIPVQRAHLVDGVHRVVGRADLSEARRAHQPEKIQAGLTILLTLEVLVALRKYLMSGVLYRAVALDIGVDHTVQVRGVSL